MVLVGDPGVFEQMIDNGTEQKRYTTLAVRMRELGELQPDKN